LSWDEAIAKLSLHGIPPEQVAKMTLRQFYYALEEINEDAKFQIRLAGGEVEDEDREATLQDLFALGL
jgi:hypothetical protein